MAPPRSRSPRGGSRKSVCQKCQRTVAILDLDGVLTAVDPELVNVVPLDGERVAIFARRVHADLCQRYQIDNDRRRARERLERERTAFAGGVGKRPKGGKVEPGS